jgi:tetratricopeptide (TPR) repeat protein
MKLAVPAIVIVALFSALAYTEINGSAAGSTRQQRLQDWKQDITVCASFNIDEYIDDSVTKDFPLLKGWDFHLPISTKSDSAQIYFDQGLILYYSFHAQEAIGSFQKAQTFDPFCAMLYWGEAMCYNDYGWYPNLVKPDVASILIEKAKQHMSGASPFEEAIINANGILLNNHSESTQDEDSIRLNNYERAMEKVYNIFSSNADAAAAYVQAVVWNDRRAYEEKKTLFISTLEKFPNHPYINHLFIHFIESTEPHLASSSAASLLKHTPGVSHLVHMTSHIYAQTGNYLQGVEVNEKARALYEEYMKLYPPVAKSAGKFLFLEHPVSMELYNAMMLPGYDQARNTADYQYHFADSFKVSRKRLFRQLGESYPDYVRIRYGKWDEILKGEKVPDSLIYRSYVKHFAAGFALARMGHLKDAASYLEKMKVLIKDPIFEKKLAVNKFSSYLGIAIPLLHAVIEEENGQFTNAETFYHEAIVLEDSLHYDDPIPWFTPVRPYLGNGLLKSGNYTKAEAIFRADLKIHPDNYWGLRGLLLALQKQKKQTESTLIQNKIETLFSYSGVEPKGAVY